MQTHPLQFVIFGLLIVVFGVVDILFLNPYVGGALIVAGAALAVFGWKRVRAAKKSKLVFARRKVNLAGWAAA